MSEDKVVKNVKKDKGVGRPLKIAFQQKYDGIITENDAVEAVLAGDGKFRFETIMGLKGKMVYNLVYVHEDGQQLDVVFNQIFAHRSFGSPNTIHDWYFNLFPDEKTLALPVLADRVEKKS